MTRQQQTVEMSETIVTMFGVLQQAKAFKQLLVNRSVGRHERCGICRRRSHVLIAAGEERI